MASGKQGSPDVSISMMKVVKTEKIAKRTVESDFLDFDHGTEISMRMRAVVVKQKAASIKKRAP